MKRHCKIDEEEKKIEKIKKLIEEIRGSPREMSKLKRFYKEQTGEDLE